MYNVPDVPLQMFQVRERQDFTKCSLHLEAEDAVNNLKQSTCHKWEGSVLFPGRICVAHPISKDGENVQEIGNTTLFRRDSNSDVGKHLSYKSILHHNYS